MDDYYQDLVVKKLHYLDSAQKNSIKSAYLFAKEAHQTQIRKSGEPYIIHPIHTASYLADINGDHDSICAALLHDTLEDTPIKYEDLKQSFNEKIANIVDGVSKLSKMEHLSPQEFNLKCWRKFLTNVADNKRVACVKLADRIHNMQTLVHHNNPGKIKTIAVETKHVFIPLAKHLGIGYFTEALEKYCFLNLYPNQYQEISSKIYQELEKFDPMIAEVKNILLQKNNHILPHLHIEAKTRYISEIADRFRRNSQISQPHLFLPDLIEFEIIVDQDKECYQALGIIHSCFTPLPGAIHDYIAQINEEHKKFGLYTKAVGRDGLLHEFHILTKDMREIEHKSAIFIHNNYKTNYVPDNWQEEVDLLHTSVETDSAFFSSFVTDILTKRLNIISQDSKIWALPQNACGIDAVYRIKNHINTKVSIKINGEKVPLKTKLQNGDLVEIYTDPEQGEEVKPEWLLYAKLKGSAAKIHEFLQNLSKRKKIFWGKQLFQKELNREQREKLDTKLLQQFIQVCGQPSLNMAYLKLGEGKLDAFDIYVQLFHRHPLRILPGAIHFDIIHRGFYKNILFDVIHAFKETKKNIINIQSFTPLGKNGLNTIQVTIPFIPYKHLKQLLIMLEQCRGVENIHIYYAGAITN